MAQTKFLIGTSAGDKVFFDYSTYTMTIPANNILSVITFDSDPRKTAEVCYKDFKPTKELKAELVAKRERLVRMQRKEYTTRGNTPRNQILFGMIEEIDSKLEEV